MKRLRIWNAMMLVACPSTLLLSGGSCLPDNIFSEVAGNIVSGLMIAGFNMISAGSGIQI